LVPGDAYVLDMGSKIWQLNTKGSVGKERFKAAEFVQSLSDARHSACEVTVYDEGGQGAGAFLGALGLGSMPDSQSEAKEEQPPILHRLSDSSGQPTFDVVEPASRNALSSTDAFVLDDSLSTKAPAVYVWIGQQASLTEKRLVLQYAQQYLYNKRAEGRTHAKVNIVKMSEGRETKAFLLALGG